MEFGERGWQEVCLIWQRISQSKPNPYNLSIASHVLVSLAYSLQQSILLKIVGHVNH